MHGISVHCIKLANPKRIMHQGHAASDAAPGGSDCSRNWTVQQQQALMGLRAQFDMTKSYNMIAY
jgi:hypothetical protein